MADKHTERTVSSIRARHVSHVRAFAGDISRNAGYVLAELEAGRVPHLRSLGQDVLMLAERVAALKAADEIAGIYRAEPEPGTEQEG